MKRNPLSKLSDEDRHRGLVAVAARSWKTTAKLLAFLAEADARRIYLTMAHPSMVAYCVYQLGYSEETAFKLIAAARTARKYPNLLYSFAEGRLHLDTVLLLAPFLTAENEIDLVSAASFRDKAEVCRMLAEWFPGPDEAA